jgi:pimeloyl-ACP methyl ester carboxylesterase
MNTALAPNGTRLGDRIDTTGFTRHEQVIDGCTTVWYEAGDGPPLVFFHGGGTFHGLTFARRWTGQHRVILPYHPNFGASDDNPRVQALHHYALHYAEFFDRLGLERFDLVALSFGGELAVEYALFQPHRVRRLVLGAPAGLHVPEHPPTDLSQVPPHEFFGYLVHDLAALAPYLPDGPDPLFGANRQRELGAVLRALQHKATVGFDLQRWLPRLRGVPSLVLWGQQDRILPVGQAAAWQAALQGELQRFDGVGHLLFDESTAAADAVVRFTGSAA